MITSQSEATLSIKKNYCWKYYFSNFYLLSFSAYKCESWYYPWIRKCCYLKKKKIIVGTGVVYIIVFHTFTRITLKSIIYPDIVKNLRLCLAYSSLIWYPLFVIKRFFSQKCLHLSRYLFDKFLKFLHTKS